MQYPVYSLCDMHKLVLPGDSTVGAACVRSVPVDSPQRFRIELLFSPGANFSPYEVVPLNKDHTLPVQPRACLHKGKNPHLCTQECLIWCVV